MTDHLIVCFLFLVEVCSQETWPIWWRKNISFLTPNIWQRCWSSFQSKCSQNRDSFILLIKIVLEQTSATGMLLTRDSPTWSSRAHRSSLHKIKILDFSMWHFSRRSSKSSSFTHVKRNSLFVNSLTTKRNWRLARMKSPSWWRTRKSNL